jgi:hypothetical protein
MLGHTSLAIYYKTMFSMVQYHKYSLSELESLIPYELDIYVEMLSEYIKELEDRNK